MDSNEAFIARSIEQNQQIVQTHALNCEKCKIWKMVIIATICVAIASIFVVLPSKPPNSRNTRATPVIKSYRIKWSKHVPGNQKSYCNIGFLVLEGTHVNTYKQDKMPLFSRIVSQETVDNILSMKQILFAEEIDIDITDEIDGMETDKLITPQKTNNPSSGFDDSVNEGDGSANLIISLTRKEKKLSNNATR
uniref:Uncharacterized protein n=1 Tax=Panagrolaimus superbus TaxID=310955 RepID=A0A914Y5C2_9BILA